jgi:hypothetical protein
MAHLVCCFASCSYAIWARRVAIRARRSAHVRRFSLSSRRLRQFGGGGSSRMAAFEHGLQSVDAAIALLQARGSAEAVSRAIAHAEGPAAVQAAWRVVDEPQPFGPSAALRADEIGP